MKTYQYWTCKKIALTTEEYESCKSNEAWILKIKNYEHIIVRLTNYEHKLQHNISWGNKEKQLSLWI